MCVVKPEWFRGTLIDGNPQWDALEAFRELSGLEPTTDQIRQAMDFGGLNDPDTIAAIPVEIAHIRSVLHRTYPALSVPPADIWAQVDLRAQNRKGKTPSDIHYIKNIIPLDVRKYLDQSGLMPVHPMVSLYREHIGRDPEPNGIDKAGFPFWQGAVDDKTAELTRSFINGITS
ncbi:MAG: hypothetical protein ABJL67_13390 [Sulfitobacter sp.]